MQSLLFVRIVFIILFTLAGYYLGGEKPLPFVIFGFTVGVLVVAVEASTRRRVSLKGLTSTVFGLMLGLLLAKLGTEFVKMFFRIQPEVFYNINIFMTFTCIYFGLTLGLKGRSEFSLVIPYVTFKRHELKEEEVVLDTSSIIDGRILDIVKSGFLEARLVVPRFVLNELRALADSTDHFKRQKGKRGIEILHSIKKESSVEIIISDDDVEGVNTVDEKIVKLAQDMGAKILTTDYNLNRIASLQGGKVLNINDLANAIKTNVVAGERFSIKLTKEGKEHNQAVGYLEDGTMVVIENAKWLIGKTTEIEVTSVLQSPSGRIIFGKLLG